MRVAFQHTDPAHPNAGVAAYRFGSVQDFTHPVTGEQHSADEVVCALLDQARAEFPEAEGYRVWPERLVIDGEEGHWEPVDEQALRARASGLPVDVPTPEVQAHVEIAADQAVATETVEG